MDELAADFCMIVNEKHCASRPSGGRGRCETGRTCADDEQIAARIELRIVGRRTIVRIDAAEAGHGADRAFEGLPTRPEKSLRSEEHTSELQSHHDLVCRL